MSEWNEKEMLKSIDDYFNNTPREQILKDFQAAGFEFENGSEEVMFTDTHNEPKRTLNLEYETEDDFKLDKYEWTLYITEELLKCELQEIPDNWRESTYYILKRGMAIAYRDTLHSLTGDEKWLKSLDELKGILID